MKRSILIVILIVSALTASAQGYVTDSSRGFDKSRLMFGGALGFSIGDYTFVNVSPLIGYRFSPMFAAGVNINAQYAAQKFRDFNGDIVERSNYSIFGGGVFARFYPFQQFFLHAQPEYNRISVKSTTYYGERIVTKDNYYAPSLLLGGGYAQPIGGNSALTIMILYDVLQDSNSPYMNRPIFSGGVNIGL